MLIRHKTPKLMLPFLLGTVLIGLSCLCMFPGASVPAELPRTEAGNSDEGAQSFLKKCAACHTIGEGETAGPDLRSVASQPGEDIAVAIMEMGEYVEELTPEEVRILTKLLRDENAQARLTAAKTGSPAPAASLKLTPDQLRAAQLFTKKCTTCHTLGGGESAASDLATVRDTAVEDLKASIKGMEDFIDDGLKDDEVDDLVVLLKLPNAAAVLAAAAKGSEGKKPATPASTPKTRTPAPTTGKSGTVASAGSAAKLYQQKCAHCHTIGGGPRMGPDLASSASWPPAKLSASIQRMSRLSGGLTDAEVQSLVSFLRTPGAAGSVAASPPVAPSTPTVTRPSTATPSTAGDMAQLYQQKCASCHTIGKGKSLGPDLKACASMPEAELTAKIEGMEAYAGALTPESVAGLVRFLQQGNAAQQLAKQAPKVAKPPAAKPAPIETEPPSFETGRKLFSGEMRFTNGGMACIGCHRAEGRGGTLGPDLGRALANLSDSMLLKVCAKPHVEAMKAAYRDHPLTPQEALHLAKYFSVEKQHTTWPGSLLFSVGQIIGVAVLVLLALFITLRARWTSTASEGNRDRTAS